MLTLREILEATKGKLINPALSATKRGSEVRKGGIEGNLDTELKGVSIDSRTIKPGELFIAIKGERFDGHNFIAEAIKKGASAIISSKQKLTAYSLKLTAYIWVPNTLKAFGDIAQSYRKRHPITVIAVTGSNGKTTTKEMLAQVLAQKYKLLKNEGTENNLIGVPKTLLKLKAFHQIAILELGTNRLGEIKRLSEVSRPQVGIITNIGPAHIEFLKNPRIIFKEKFSLIQSLKHPRLGLLNVDDRYLASALKNREDKLLFSYGVNRPCDFRATQIYQRDKELLFSLNRRHKIHLNLLGRHNVYNALATIGLALTFGLSLKQIRKALAQFRPLSRRLNLQKMARFNILDDTYNSNPISLNSALEVLSKARCKGKRILVMGDMLELGKRAKFWHKWIGKIIANGGIEFLVTVGELSKLSARAAVKEGMLRDTVIPCLSLSSALDKLSKLVDSGDLLLIKGSRGMKMERIIEGLRSLSC